MDVYRANRRTHRKILPLPLAREGRGGSRSLQVRSDKGPEKALDLYDEEGEMVWHHGMTFDTPEKEVMQFVEGYKAGRARGLELMCETIEDAMPRPRLADLHDRWYRTALLGLIRRRTVGFFQGGLPMTIITARCSAARPA